MPHALGRVVLPGAAVVVAVGVVGALHGVADLLLAIALVVPAAILAGVLAWSRLSGDGLAPPSVDWAIPPGPPWQSHATLAEIEPLPPGVQMVRWCVRTRASMAPATMRPPSPPPTA